MKKIIAILSAVMMAAGCTETTTVESRFEVNGLNDVYTFAADLGQTFTFDIVSDNVLWEVFIEPLDQEWLVVTPMRSLGGYETVTITADDNESGVARECKLVLQAENGYSKEVKVTQKAD